MMQFEERNSGLVLPVQPPEKPSREYGLLEIQHGEHRRQAGEALQLLVNVTRAGNVVIGYKSVIEMQRTLVVELGKKLLGDDWSYWEYT